MSDPNQHANVQVLNEFGCPINNVVLKHRYDEDLHEEGSWNHLENGAQSSTFQVGYWTGFMRTGRDYWRIYFDADGKRWTCKDNFYCYLTSDDANKTVVIRVYKTGSSSGKMDVLCPSSSLCTVSLDV